MDNNNVKHLAFFLGGVAAGTLAGILLAPDSGKNTRGRISYQFDKYADDVKNLLKRTDEIAEQYTDMRAEDYQKAEDLLGEVNDFIDDIQKKAKK